jgi:trigger factor
MKKGESKTFPMKFPDDYFGKEVAGKQSEFTVLVHEVKEKKLPMMDNDFVKEVSGFETVAELRAKIEEDIKAHRNADQRAKSAEQIAEQLIKAHAFDVPSSLVDMELQRLVQQGAERMKQQGIDVNKLGEDQQKEFVDKLRPVSERNVHMALIVEKISEKENIHCEPKDFEAYVERVSKNVNQPPDTVRRYIQQQGNQESIQDWIGYEKTLDFLIAEAKE